MKPLLAIPLLAVTLLAACDELTDPEVLPGQVQWQLSAGTCVGASNIALSVDGSVIAIEALSAGQTSRVFDVTPGDHLLAAREDVALGLVWNEQRPVFFVPGQAIVRVLDCL